MSPSLPLPSNNVGANSERNCTSQYCIRGAGSVVAWTNILTPEPPTLVTHTLQCILCHLYTIFVSSLQYQCSLCPSVHHHFAFKSHPTLLYLVIASTIQSAPSRSVFVLARNTVHTIWFIKQIHLTFFNTSINNNNCTHTTYTDTIIHVHCCSLILPCTLNYCVKQ